MGTETQKKSVATKIGTLSTRSAKNGKNTSNHQEHVRRLWHKALLASVFVLSAIALFVAAFMSLAHGSFAQISVGSVSVKANTSEAGLQKQITQAAASYKITLQYPDGTKKAYALARTLAFQSMFKLQPKAPKKQSVTP